MAVRSMQKGKDAAKKLNASFPKATIDVWPLDMCSYESIHAFAQRAQAELSRLDIVILNAGVGRFKYGTAPSTGHEETIQTNYLSTALLTILLLPILKNKSPAGTPGRLTLINSALAFSAKFKNRDTSPLLPSFDDPKAFDPQEYYNVSKLLGQMFLWKLVDYVSADDVIVNLVCPGAVGGTQLARDVPWLVLVLLKMIFGLITRSLPDGAASYLDATLIKGKESHGTFIMGWQVGP